MASLSHNPIIDLNSVNAGLPLFLCAAAGAIAYSVLPSKRTQLVEDIWATYPPGPRPDPVLGHARYIPPHYTWLKFSEWAKKFGDVMHLHVLGRPMIILSSAEAAHDLMDKKGANYSDRPRFVHLGEMMSDNSMLVFQRYGSRFRKQRRLMQQTFNSKSVASFQPISRKEALNFLNNLLNTPEHFRKHIHRWISSTLVRVTYGHEVVSEDDRLIDLVERTGKMMLEYGAAGAAVVDFFPFLKHIPSWLPGAEFKRYAQRTRVLFRAMSEAPYNKVKADRAENVDKRSFVNSMLAEYEGMNVVDEEHEELMRSVAAVVYGAGVETTEATIETFFLLMSLHPQAMRRAQEEIDRVIGSSRLPTLSDRADLPFVDCIMKETLRVNPPVPLGIPHSSIEEDVYRSMYIPPGSMVIANIWHMMHDERVYPNPDKFMPERFLDKEGHSIAQQSGGSGVAETSGVASDPTSIVYGFGRRICPGRFFADTSVWQVMACVLAVFDILPPLNPVTGEELRQVPEYTPGVTCHPKEYKCRVIPRSAEHAKLIRQEHLSFSLNNVCS